MNNIPWSEKYRPNDINNIIFDNFNKLSFSNMLEFNNIQNLLLYGPPGTGKTTTIVNFINKYQVMYEKKNKSLTNFGCAEKCPTGTTEVASVC